MNARRLFGALIVAGVLGCGLLVTAVQAQERQPIYPAYDGFLKNPDGSYTIAFAYFSHNSDVVTVPAGTANSFAPGGGDRMQPTSFKPGHWRFQCVMVMPPDFDGKMVWTLDYGGAKTGTSQAMLQSNWFLVEGAEDLAKVDFTKAPKGVCLNRAPAVRVLGANRQEGTDVLGTVAAVGAQESLFGSVNDEGLPRGSALTASWMQVSGPAQAKFENTSRARTHVVYPAAGSYVFELSASDGELNAERRITVNVK